jgi:molybdopterin biosynthesis enzyme
VATREGGDIVVTLNDQQGSGSLPSFVGVNALAILPPESAELRDGDRVDVILWGSGLRAAHSFFEGRG